jgi:DNA polymerase III alpha subunit
MTKNKFGELVFDESDLIDLLMTNGAVPDNLIVLNVEIAKDQLDHVPTFINPADESMSVKQFDLQNQANWFMPYEYKNLDIAEHVLSLCNNDQELQRVGHELLLYQERDLFNLLRYLKYLIDTMKQNGIIWGVGRGSSVASYVLYLLGVHRIDSIYYDLDPEEFLR